MQLSKSFCVNLVLRHLLLFYSEMETKAQGSRDQCEIKVVEK